MSREIASTLLPAKFISLFFHLAVVIMSFALNVSTIIPYPIKKNEKKLMLKTSDELGRYREHADLSSAQIHQQDESRPGDG